VPNITTNSNLLLWPIRGRFVHHNTCHDSTVANWQARQTILGSLQIAEPAQIARANGIRVGSHWRCSGSSTPVLMQERRSEVAINTKVCGWWYNTVCHAQQQPHDHTAQNPASAPGGACTGHQQIARPVPHAAIQHQGSMQCSTAA